MKLKGRSLLVIALLIFGGYAVFDFLKEKKRENEFIDQAKLMTINKDQIDSVIIEKGSEKITLKRNIQGWSLETPLKDFADNDVVEDFIKSMASEKINDVAKEGSDIDWSLFGLDKPMGRIQISNSAGQKWSIEVSEKRNFEENPFVRRNSEQKVLIVNQKWQQRLQNTAMDFRERHVLRHKMGAIDSFKLSKPHEKLEFILKDGKWSVSTFQDIPLDQNKVRELLQTLADAKAAEYMNSAIPGLKSLVTIELKMADKIWVAELVQAQDFKIYAKVSNPKFYLKLEPGALDKWVQLKIDDLKENVEKASGPVKKQKDKK